MVSSTVVVAAAAAAVAVDAARLAAEWGPGGSVTVRSEGHVLFTSPGTMAVFCSGQWWSTADGSLKPAGNRTFTGSSLGLGPFQAIELRWQAGATPFVTTLRNFNDGLTVTFEQSWPSGASKTSLVEHNVSGSRSNQEVLANFPALTSPVLGNTLSWAGSFVGAQHNRGTEVTGPTGGPTVFFDAGDPSLSTVVVLSPLDKFKASSAGPGATWDKQHPAFAPGTAGTITSIPEKFTHTFVMRVGSESGITAAIGEWGTMLQNVHKTTRVKDITLTNIGYQTDNGAAYVFCRPEAPYKDCNELLIAELQQLKAAGVPMGYLSFQGAGSSTTSKSMVMPPLGQDSNRNDEKLLTFGGPQAAPWCVNEWGPDLNTTQRKRGVYPMPTKQFQQELGVPLQLYAPYFCPSSKYFSRVNPNSNWTSVESDTTLPGCSFYGFQDVSPSESRSFYDWFFAKGLADGMASFEPDFMNQNYNCVPDFIESATNADVWQHGMTDAALAANLTVQWCYAAPTDVLNSLTMPALTNFRVSTDFCYGNSWNVGSSSLIVWAVNAAPSKDTLWTTDNGKFEVPGCPWTSDHETPAAELHVVIALMTTGPVGISDRIGMTNAALIKRTITMDGTLLKPCKPLTTIDSSLASGNELDSHGSGSGRRGPPGIVYSSYSTTQTTSAAAHNVVAWYFVSFKMKESWTLPQGDFYPALPKGRATALLTRRYSPEGCVDGAKPLSGCVELVSYGNDDLVATGTPISLPKSDATNVTGGTDYTPAVTTVWPICKSGWAFLGELRAYVAVSAVRFQSVTCTTTGVKANVVGSPGETVIVTLVSGTISDGPQLWAEGTVVIRKVKIGSAGHAEVSSDHAL